MRYRPGVSEPALTDDARRPRRLEAGLLVAAVALFLVGYGATLAAPGISYSWQHNMISDLGRASCRQWQGRWICSPRAAWLNMGVIASGTCLLAATARLARTWGAALTAAMAALGLGLVTLGTFPSDTTTSLHMTGAVLALPLPATGIAASGWRATTPWLRRFRGTRLALGLLALALCLDHLHPAHPPIPRGTAETISMAALLAVIGIEAWRCARSEPALPSGAHGR